MAYAEAFMAEFGIGGGLRAAASARHQANLIVVDENSNQLLDCARRLLLARRKLMKMVPRGLFRDSAWDMMLELFIGSQENCTIYIKQLMIASGETAASAIRRIDRLDEAGFLERTPDFLDQRRVIVRLTRRGMEAMTAMLTDLDAASCIEI